VDRGVVGGGGGLEPFGVGREVGAIWGGGTREVVREEEEAAREGREGREALGLLAPERAV
jgi:hypothetical protein